MVALEVWSRPPLKHTPLSNPYQPTPLHPTVPYDMLDLDPYQPINPSTYPQEDPKMLHTKWITPAYRDTPQLFTHNDELAEDEAKMAAALIERWGMVAAIPDGEDSAGRAKLRLATPEELVARAFSCAKLAMKHARDNNLLHKTDPVPDLSDIQAPHP